MNMWYSFKDKWDIVPHDERKHSRKFKRSNVVLLPTLLVVFIAGTFTFSQAVEHIPYASYIPFATAILAVIICIVLMILKWVKNDREFDFFLFVASILFAFLIYIGYKLI